MNEKNLNGGGRCDEEETIDELLYKLHKKADCEYACFSVLRK